MAMIENEPDVFYKYLSQALSEDARVYRLFAEIGCLPYVDLEGDYEVAESQASSRSGYLALYSWPTFDIDEKESLLRVNAEGDLIEKTETHLVRGGRIPGSDSEIYKRILDIFLQHGLLKPVPEQYRHADLDKASKNDFTPRVLFAFLDTDVLKSTRMYFSYDLDPEQVLAETRNVIVSRQ